MRESNQTARRAGGRRSAIRDGGASTARRRDRGALRGAQSQVRPDYLGEVVDQDGTLDYPNNVMIFARENVQLLHGR
jgi:hypothetical protein